MPRLLVLADDLTGANDAGAQFAKHGILTYVSTHWQFADLDREADTGVVVINTQSRHMTPDDAFSTVTKLAKAAKAVGIQTIYKKTDSTLRGNIGSEIEAVMQASESPFIVYIPAFPDARRFIREGVLYLDDKLVTETSFANDILAPVRHSYLPDLIGEQSELPYQVVSLSRLRQNAVDFRQPGYLFIVDGETNGDLRQTATILRDQGVTGVFAGTAAFAEHLIELLELPSVPVTEPEIHGPVMVVNGSINPVSLAQLRHGLTHGYVPCQLTPEMLVAAPDGSTDGSFERQVGHACDVLARGEHLLVHMARTEAETHAYLRIAGSNGTSRHDVPQVLVTAVAQFVRDVVERTRMRTLMIFGGETAYTMLQALGCQRARVLKEISLGTNVLETEALNQRIQVITKSGGFGTPEFLEDFLTCLSE